MIQAVRAMVAASALFAKAAVALVAVTPVVGVLIRWPRPRRPIPIRESSRLLAFRTVPQRSALAAASRRVEINTAILTFQGQHFAVTPRRCRTLGAIS
jgi:hypothetical protein